MKLFKMTIIASVVCIFSSTLYAGITVIKVEGNAAFREGRSWIPLKEKMNLPEGVKISTGANSFAELSLNSINHTVKIKPLTVIQVFSKESAENTDTHIGLKRGGIIAKVPRDSKVKTVFKVSTPIATSSVRGTEEDISYGPVKGMIVKVLAGIIEGKNRHGRSNYISGRQNFVQISGNALARDILNDVRVQSFIPVYGNGLSPAELATLQFFGDEQLGSRDDDVSGLVNPSVPKTKVTIDFNSPR